MNQPPDHRMFARSREQLATVLSVTVRSVGRWLEHADAPPKGPDGYDLTAWVRWFTLNKAEVAHSGPTTADADRRIKIARAEILEMEARRKRGELIPVAEADARSFELLRWTVGVFERAGSELAGKLAGKRPAEQRKAVCEYFDDVRLDATKKPGPPTGGQARKARPKWQDPQPPKTNRPIPQ